MSLGRPTRNMQLVIHDDSIIDHGSLFGYEANEHIDWTDTDEDLLTTGSLGAKDGTFYDITISNPSNIYMLSHDSFADYVADEHIDWKDTDEDLSTTGSLSAKGHKYNVVSKTADYTATASDDVIFCGAGNESFTICLPSPTESAAYHFKNFGTGEITLDADTVGSTLIDGAKTAVIKNQYETVTVVSDGIKWGII